ncbi:MAG TPA: TIGR02281 family clan AA aspartic protease [Xanthobacteraceae bacterium]
MQRRLLWPLLIGLGLALLVLLLSRDEDLIAGLARHDFARLAAKVALGLVIGGLVFVLFRQRLSEALQAALFWVVLALLLAVAYSFRGDLRAIGDRVLADLIPGRPVQVGRAVEIARGRSGEFFVDTQVNGARIGMVLDTGASSVVLTPEAAKAAGLPLEVLSYSVTIETANGRARAAPVMLDRIAVGSILERSVPALVAQPGQLRVSLLGMSFLNRLEGWDVRNDRLRMRAQ